MIKRRAGMALFGAVVAVASLAGVAGAPSANAAPRAAAASSATVAPRVDDSAREGREGYTYNYYWNLSGCMSMGEFGVSTGMWYFYICKVHPSQYPGQYIYELYVS